MGPRDVVAEGTTAWRRGIRVAGCLLVAGGLLAAGLRLDVPRLGAQTLALRVVANSNRPLDQQVKLQVRDAVLAALEPGLASAPNAAAARGYVAARLPQLRAVAQSVASRAGQSATVRLGPEAFPARRIGLLSFPAATLPALVVTLGSGRGHNWWTVLFPSLSLVTVGGQLVVVGPGGAAEPVRDVPPKERQALLAWVSGRTGVPLDFAVSAAGPDGAPGARVEVRFALWDLVRQLPWPQVRGGLLRVIGAARGA